MTETQSVILAIIITTVVVSAIWHVLLKRVLAHSLLQLEEILVERLTNEAAGGAYEIIQQLSDSLKVNLESVVKERSIILRFESDVHYLVQFLRKPTKENKLKLFEHTNPK